jgi:hypothetical protein
MDLMLKAPHSLVEAPRSLVELPRSLVGLQESQVEVLMLPAPLEQCHLRSKLCLIVAQTWH